MGNPPGDRLGEADRLSKRLLGTPRDGQNGGPSASTGGWRWSTDGTSSADLLNLRLRLLQPVRHVHFAIHRRRGGERTTGLANSSRAVAKNQRGSRDVKRRLTLTRNGRLLRLKAPFVDLERLDLRLERGRRHAEPRGGAEWPGHAALAVVERRLDD